MQLHSILLVGCGKMGRALLDRWSRADIAERIHVIEPVEPRDLPDNVTWYKDAASYRSAAMDPPDAIILAVKPQALREACAPLANYSPNAVVISIAAGWRCGAIGALFDAPRVIVRAMPNTPAAIGKGVTALFIDREGASAQKTIADTLFSAVGDVAWVDDERDFDAITAVSGSGPAYLFLLMETLAKAGMDAGLAPPVAAQLARQTIIGAAALAEVATDSEAATLRRNVTSPGGTTEAALAVLMNETSGLQSLMTAAVAAATKRSRDLND